MLVQNQIRQFLQNNYKQKILKQIPSTYISDQALLTLSLNIDLLKIFTENRQLGIFVVTKYSLFYSQCINSLKQMMINEGLASPEYGIHLIIVITNCPLPTKNISSPQFLLAAFQQKDGIMAYFGSATVTQIFQPEVYLFSATQIWIPQCGCLSIQNFKKHRKINKNLIEVVKESYYFNGSISFKNKNPEISETDSQFICQICQKKYKFLQTTDQIYLNCQKVRLIIPKNIDSLEQTKFSIFSSHQLIVYTQNGHKNQIKVGDQISCCCHIFCKQMPVKSSISVNTQLLVKPVLKTYMISYNKINTDNGNEKKPLLLTNSQNNMFFSELISLTDLYFQPCTRLLDYEKILNNYNSLINEVNKIRFPYLNQDTLTTFKLSILNSIFSHYCLNNNLHLLIMVEQIQIILRALTIKNLVVKFWPTDYDQATLKSWLLAVKGSIVIVSNPSKKDLKLLQRFIGSNNQQFNNSFQITFWVVSENFQKKDFNIHAFAIVLDLTYEKNRYICKNILDQSTDQRLSAFITPQAQQDEIYTIPRIKNPRARISLIDTFKKQSKIKPNKLDTQQQEHETARQMLQKYYLKCRQLKKTSNSSLNYLLKLGSGFSTMVYFMGTKKPDIKNKSYKLSILDAVLAIFLDEQSSRHKYSSSNTIFGTDVSKLILNQKQCELSFLDYECGQDGILRQNKNYMPKDEMMKKMLYRLNELIYEDQLLLFDGY